MKPRTSACRPAHSSFGPDVEIARQRQRAALAGEQMAGERIGPQRHLIEPAQHRVHLAGIVAKPAAFDGREHVALQQHAFGPSRRQSGGVVFRASSWCYAAAATRR
jgi:hypothetical protein